MLYFDRIDISEGVNVNKISASAIVVFYEGFKFQPYTFSGCDDVLKMSINLNGIAISNIGDVDYRYIINEISKIEVEKLLQNTDLSYKNRSL